MSIIEDAVRIFAPYTCIGCGVEEDALLCEACLQDMPPVPSQCYRCKAVTENYLVCAECEPDTPLRQVVVYTGYTGHAKQIVHRMKYERAKAATQEIGSQLAGQTVYFSSEAVFALVPTATSRVRMRGYDHAALSARQAAIRADRSHRALLRRVGQARQVGADREQRVRQLEGVFRVVRPSEVRGRHIVLVDDVLTTGSTLENAARTLIRHGATRVDALVFAQA